MPGIVRGPDQVCGDFVAREQETLEVLVERVNALTNSGAFWSATIVSHLMYPASYCVAELVAGEDREWLVGACAVLSLLGLAAQQTVAGVSTSRLWVLVAAGILLGASAVFWQSVLVVLDARGHEGLWPVGGPFPVLLVGVVTATAWAGLAMGRVVGALGAVTDQRRWDDRAGERCHRGGAAVSRAQA